MPTEDGDPEYPEMTGKRRDGRNLVKEWIAHKRTQPGTRAR